jgi:hypothetical protein
VQKELTLEEFYAADPQRAATPEVPYGRLWREFAPVPTYRLAWVPTTGELYATELSEPDEDKDPVEASVCYGAAPRSRPALPAGPSAVAANGRCSGPETRSQGGVRWSRRPR